MRKPLTTMTTMMMTTSKRQLGRGANPCPRFRFWRRKTAHIGNERRTHLKTTGETTKTKRLLVNYKPPTRERGESRGRTQLPACAFSIQSSADAVKGQSSHVEGRSPDLRRAKRHHPARTGVFHSVKIWTVAILPVDDRIDTSREIGGKRRAVCGIVGIGACVGRAC